jgi:hypothetical protein
MHYHTVQALTLHGKVVTVEKGVPRHFFFKETCDRTRPSRVLPYIKGREKLKPMLQQSSSHFVYTVRVTGDAFLILVFFINTQL